MYELHKVAYRNTGWLRHHPGLVALHQLHDLGPNDTVLERE